MPPFEPVGEEARWKVIYEILREAPEDEIVPYERLLDALGLDPEQRAVVHLATRRAVKELQEKDRRTVATVRGKGYRVATPEEHMPLGMSHHAKAGRALVRARNTVNSTDLNRIEDPAARHAVEQVVLALANEIEVNRRMRQKVDQHDWDILTLAANQAHTNQAIDLIRDHQQRLEAKMTELAEKLE